MSIGSWSIFEFTESEIASCLPTERVVSVSIRGELLHKLIRNQRQQSCWRALSFSQFQNGKLSVCQKASHGVCRLLMDRQFYPTLRIQVNNFVSFHFFWWIATKRFQDPVDFSNVENVIVIMQLINGCVRFWQRSLGKFSNSSYIWYFNIIHWNFTFC